MTLSARAPVAASELTRTNTTCLDGPDAPPLVSLPQGATSFGAQLAGPGQVAIWKLHGTASNWRTVRSQAADLARNSLTALRRIIALQPRRMVIAGYSGRDFDLFPWLVRVGRRAQTLWIDLDFWPGHRAHSMPNCIKVTADFETLARRFWSTPDARITDWVREVTAATSVSSAVSDRIRQEFDRRVSDGVRASVTEVFGGNVWLARAALAAAINTVADFPLAQEILETIPAANRSVRTNLLSFFALSSMDRHRDAEQAARVARMLGFRQRNVVGLMRAELALTYSRQRRHITTFHDAEIRAASRQRLRSLSVLIRMLVDAAALVPMFLVVVRQARLRLDTARHFDLLDLGSDYVEHLIRIGALLDRMVAARFGSRTPVALEPFWRLVRRLAVHIGYMRGVINTGKYLARHRGYLYDGLDVHFGAEVVGDYIAGAIAARDAGLRLLRSPSPDPATRAAALRLLVRSIRLANEAGNPTLVLKALLIASDHGLALPSSIVDVEALLDRLQGEADELAVPVIRRRLSLSEQTPG